MTTFTVERRAAGFVVIRQRPDAVPITIAFDTTHDVAAAALLCDATVVTDDINVRHACRAVRVKVLWPEEINQ